MADKKKKALGRGLGKGLDTVIPPQSSGEGRSKKGDSPSSGGEVFLKINEVEPNKKQPRKNFDEEKLGELSDSISKHGIVQPLVVTKEKGYYRIIAGERRWRAAKLAGLKEVPVVIKEYTPQEVMEVALIENIQREDLNPVEEALAYQNLIDEYKLRQEDVAEKVSKNRTTITNSLRLLKLDDVTLDYLSDGLISSGHARALLTIEDDSERKKLADRIIKENLTVRDVEKLTSGKSAKSKKKKTKKLENEFIYEDLENKLKEKTGTKVSIHRKNETQGKIEIEYYSQDELEKIIGLFG